jgi:hypothetical protein
MEEKDIKTEGNLKEKEMNRWNIKENSRGVSGRIKVQYQRQVMELSVKKRKGGGKEGIRSGSETR